MGNIKPFLHPDLLRTISFDREAADNFFKRIKRETEAVEELRKRGFEDAWAIVKLQRGWIN